MLMIEMLARNACMYMRENGIGRVRVTEMALYSGNIAGFLYEMSVHGVAGVMGLPKLNIQYPASSILNHPHKRPLTFNNIPHVRGGFNSRFLQAS